MNLLAYLPLKRGGRFALPGAKRVGIEPLIELLTASLTLPLAGGGDAALLPLPRPTKRKRPWGAGVFVGPTWGTVGSSIIHAALWGLVKRRVNSQKLLSHHRRVRTGYHDRLACFDAPRGLRGAII